ncbi:hypothetical protein, partial [Inquilinus limosus]|uniref:hypothetical protein n=1 Tax=Inquilinus limosus TaxID=171674 RepID=UPI001B7FCAD5
PGVGTNRYAYSDNDPINLSDPSGHQWAGAADAQGSMPTGAAASQQIQAEAERQRSEQTKQDEADRLYRSGAVYSSWDDFETLATLGTNLPKRGAVSLGRKMVEKAIGTEPVEAVAPKAVNIISNKAAGKAFEDETAASLQQLGTVEIGREVLLETPKGVRTRMDILTRDKITGEIGCIECKASATAPLTPNQRASHPEIAGSGATVVSTGVQNFPAGMNVPPTTVNVIRKKSE